MAALVSRRPRAAQAPPAMLIDWDAPIWQGLVFLYVCGNEAVGFGEDGRNAIPYANTIGTVVGQRVNTLAGTAAQALSGSSYAFAPTQTSAKGSAYSLFAFGTGPAIGTQSAIDDDDGTARRFQFRLNAGKAEFIPFSSGGNGSVAASSTLSTADLVGGFTMGAVANGSSYAVYQNGVKTAGSTALSGNALTPNPSIWVGARKINGNQGWTSGGLMVVGMWNRALTDAEHAWLSDNRDRLIRTAGRRRLWVAASAPTSGSLVVTSSGGIALNGVAAAVRSTLRQAQGGLQMAGTAPQSRGAARSAVGGMQLTGTAGQARTRAATPTGGMQLSGAASIATSTVKQLLAVVAAGGIALAGTAARVASAVRAATGGFAVGGSADYTNSGIVPRLSAIMRRRARPRSFPTSR